MVFLDEALYGSDYTKNADYKADKDAIQNEETYLENASVQEFMQQYEGKNYEIKYLTPARSKNGKVKNGGNGYLIAVHEKSVFLRLWDYIIHFFTIETTNDVTDPELTERYIRV